MGSFCLPEDADCFWPSWCMGSLALHRRFPVEEAVGALLKVQSSFYFLITYLCNFDSKNEFMGVATMFFRFAKNQNFTDSLC